ncbi:MAG: hypothetical protein MUF54_23405 [Polyangiaceae bacterium]|nr:hypothetical protein [Polyangiaceae bacterium]
MPKPGAGEPRTPQRVPAPTGTAGTPTTPSPAHGRSKPALPAASEPQSASRPSLPAPPPPLPVRLDALLASGPVGHLVQSVRACYRDNTPAPTGVTVRVETSIRIEVAPDGHVAFAHFDPPLAPKAQLCASAVVAHTQFPRAQLASTLNVPLTL